MRGADVKEGAGSHRLLLSVPQLSEETPHCSPELQIQAWVGSPGGPCVAGDVAYSGTSLMILDPDRLSSYLRTGAPSLATAAGPGRGEQGEE